MAKTFANCRAWIDADNELRDWVARLREQGWKTVYVYFKHEDKGTAPKLAKRLLELADAAAMKRP